MGCDLSKEEAIKIYGVSIHAPTWGATIDVVGRYIELHVSIHAPTWGATTLLCSFKP